MEEKDMTSVLEDLKIKDFNSSVVIARTLDFIPVGMPNSEEISRLLGEVTNDVEGKVHQIIDESKTVLLTAIRWTCLSNKRNHLLFNGSPLRAQELHFGSANISWQAGDGHPVYTSYCPQNHYHTRMYFPHHKVHQIVPEFGGYAWTGCNTPAWGRGNAVTDVFFTVNDDDYRDNRGTFDIIITGWA